MIKNGAKAIIICDDKFLLFHRDNNPHIEAPDCWCSVGGGIEEGETPEEGLLREMTEEIQYRPKNYIFLKKYIGSKGEDLYTYLIKVPKEDLDMIKHGPGEGQDIGWFTLEEMEGLKLTHGVREMLESGYFKSFIK